MKHQMSFTDISKRHHTEHPMTKLTEEELHVLDTLSKCCGLFNDRLNVVLEVLGTLASLEDTDRVYQESTDSR